MLNTLYRIFQQFCFYDLTMTFFCCPLVLVCYQRQASFMQESIIFKIVKPTMSSMWVSKEQGTELKRRRHNLRILY